MSGHNIFKNQGNEYTTGYMEGYVSPNEIAIILEELSSGPNPILPVNDISIKNRSERDENGEIAWIQFRNTVTNLPEGICCLCQNKVHEEFAHHAPFLDIDRERTSLSLSSSSFSTAIIQKIIEYRGGWLVPNDKTNKEPEYQVVPKLHNITPEEIEQKQTAIIAEMAIKAIEMCCKYKGIDSTRLSAVQDVLKELERCATPAVEGLVPR